MLAGPAVWVRDGERCHRATPEGEVLRVPLCGRCSTTVDLHDGLTLPGVDCPTSAGSALRHMVPAWVLVHAGDDQAGWRSPVQVGAAVLDGRAVEEPCTAASATAPGAVDGVRRCDVSTAFEVFTIPYGTGGPPVGTGTTRSPTPVDCAAPCPPNPVLAELARVRARLAASAWTLRGDEELRV